MSSSIDILVPFRTRFKVEYSDEWIASMLRLVVTNTEPTSDDVALLKARFQRQWELPYEPTDDAIRIARWIYDLARGFALDRYSDTVAYEARCSEAITKIAPTLGKSAGRNPDETPIYGVDGLPGVGKSALRKALERLWPPPQLIGVEGDPPSPVRMISAVYLEVTRNFSLVHWMQRLLMQLGADWRKVSKLKSIDDLANALGKLLYRHGVVLLIVDELQWLAGGKVAAAAMNLLRDLRLLGVPILFFANTDLMIRMDNAPAQLAQRIPRGRETLAPPRRGESAFRKVIEAYLALLPYGHTLDLTKDDLELYDKVAALPRALGRLFEVALDLTARGRQPIDMIHLKEAYEHDDFRTLRTHIELLRSLAVIDVKKRPELSSANSPSRKLAEYMDTTGTKKLADAAAIVVRSEMTDAEREAELATMTKILRTNGQIDPNIFGIGESKVQRQPASVPGADLSTSAFTKRLAGHVSANPKASRPKSE